MDVLLEHQAKLAGTVLTRRASRRVGEADALIGAGESMNVPLDEASGRFGAEGLGSGEYRLAVSLGDGPGAAGERITLEAGKTEARNIRVKRPAPGAEAAPPPM